MALKDIFKKKEKEAKPAEKPKQIKEKETPKEPVLEKKFPKQAEVRPPQVKREVRTSRAYRVLKSPHITEKATDLTKKNQYVFKVFPKANKSEIRKTIEGLYGVDVISVKIINIPPKKRRLGKISGWKPGYKKAIIGVEEGQKIEVLPR